MDRYSTLLKRPDRNQGQRQFFVGLGRFGAPGPVLPADPTDDEVIAAIRSVPMHFTAVTITVASIVAAANATLERGIAGATLTAGQSVYADSSAAGVLKLADANVSALTAAAVGITTHGALSGQPISYITAGNLGMGVCLTAGLWYVVGATPGDIAPAADLAQGWYSTRLGYATTTANLRVDLRATGVVLA